MRMLLIKLLKARENNMQDIFRDTVIAAADTAENLFVGIGGALAASVDPYGVTMFGAEIGAPMDVVVLGLAEVKFASGQTPVVGDYVKSDATGFAVVDNTNGKIKVKSVGTSMVEVLMR
jgi:hypothetical protein